MAHAQSPTTLGWAHVPRDGGASCFNPPKAKHFTTTIMPPPSSTSESSSPKPAASTPVRRATAASIARQPKATTLQALEGYRYLKACGSRRRTPVPSRPK